MHERLIGFEEVKHRTSLSRNDIYRRMRDRLFPQPIKVGTRRVAWRESDVQAWIDCIASGVSWRDWREGMEPEESERSTPRPPSEQLLIPPDQLLHRRT